MKGTQIGEFEELVLLVVGSLYPEAYGVNVRQEIVTEMGRKVALGAVHSSMNRLEDKGFLTSVLAEKTHIRGGRRKRLYQVTIAGKKVLEMNRSLRNNLWEKIPSLAWEGLNNGNL